MRSKLGKIVLMEFRLTAANKTVIILTILGPFLIAAVTVLPTVLSVKGTISGGKEVAIAIVNADPRFFESVRPILSQSGIRAVETTESEKSLDARVLAGSLDGYVVLPTDLLQAARLQYVSKNAMDIRVTSSLQAAIAQAIVAQRLVKTGVPESQVAELMRPPTIETRQVMETGEKKTTDFLTILMTGLVLAMVIYMTVLLYGQAVGRSVLTEKTSKTVEILLSSVRPMDLLFGKVLGKAAASLLQYGLWVTISAAFLAILGPRLGVGIALGVSIATLGYLVLYFVLAFLLYCSIFAALGAASQDEQHLGQLSWPLILFLVLPIVLISPLIMNPNAPLVVALSLFPPTAAIVMFLRIVAGGVPAWQVLASVALLLASIAAVIALSAKIFRVGLLMTGKRFRLGEVVRWLRY
jgi:ABC-2 type transport system permease protein